MGVSVPTSELIIFLQPPPHEVFNYSNLPTITIKMNVNTWYFLSIYSYIV